MNLRDLEYFVTVAELGHFRRAAEKLHVTQPTLSGQLKKLEDELGMSLLERLPKGVMLTAFGRDVLEHAQRVLAEARAIEGKARAAADPRRGPLELGVFPTLGPWLLPRVTVALAEAFPKIDFYFLEDKSPELRRRLLEGTLDVALLALPESSATLHVERLFRDPLLLAVPVEHPLAARRSIHASELADLELMLLEEGHCLRDQVLDVCSMLGATTRDRYRATSLATLREMVRAGTGVTLFPELAIPRGTDAEIRYLRIDAPEPAREIGVVYRDSHPRARVLRELGRVIRRVMSP